MVMLPPEGEVLAGKYRVERVVGRGGMGIVVAAWHLELDHRIALKFLHPELAERPEAAERFRREARAAAKLKSEHVVRVLDVATFEGATPYMVLEYLDGRDLSDELVERGVLPITEALDYVLQTIDAVAEAHSVGIVHRDLKPENLFLARRPDGHRIVKVLDFGISKTLVLGSDERSLTETSSVMGSPLYMSPEQMRTPRDIDARSDIWSIGAILYDLLAGRPPYIADTLAQLCVIVLETEPEPLTQLRTGLDPDLEQVVARCLAKDRTQRWGNVAELARALLPFASPSSRIHADRAGRVLSARVTPNAGGTLPSAVSLPPHVPSMGRNPSPAVARRTPGAAPSGPRGEPSGGPAPTDGAGIGAGSSNDVGTQESWGSTQDSARRAAITQPIPGSAFPRGLLLGGAALLVAALVVLVRMLAGPKNASPPPIPSGEAALLPSIDAATSPMVAVPSVAPEADTQVVPVLTPSASAEPRPTTLTPVAGTSVAAPVRDGLAKKRTSFSPPASSGRPDGAADLTDFGGRR